SAGCTSSISSSSAACAAAQSNTTNHHRLLPTRLHPSSRRPEAMFSLTVLYDPECGLCSRAHEWLAEQAKLVELNFVPCASDEARRRYPQLNHDLTKKDLTLVGDDGGV